MQALNGFERISIPKSKFWNILDPAVIFIALFDKQDVNVFRYSRNDIILQGKSIIFLDRYTDSWS